MNIIQHFIPIKEGVNPFQQNIHKVTNTLDIPIQKELKKNLDARITFKVCHSMWVSNLVFVRKQSKETRPYVDFLNLNQEFDKDNYLVPPMG
jgi:hypothetical protein